MSLRKVKPKTLSEKISRLAGPESSEDSDEDATAPQVVDFDEYDSPGSRFPEFRKNNIKLLSDQSIKYKGKLSSRKDFEEEAESEHEPYEASKSESEGFEENQTNEDSDSSNVTANSNENFRADQEELDEEIATEAEPIKVVSEKKHQVDLQKGVCVLNQLKIWEKLLELRIHSQKLLSKANQLPAPSDFSVPEPFVDKRNKSVKQISTLLSTLLELQEKLSGQFSEIRNVMKTSRKRSAALIGNYEDGAPAIKRFAEQLDQRFHSFQQYRNEVLLKWDDRTKLLNPGAGAKKKTFNEDFNIIRIIENALQNRRALKTKSQVIKNSNNNTLEVEASNNNAADDENRVLPNVHIYDDTDFYHQQLRELIEYKANTSSNMAEVTKQYVELQKLRQKMKAKVDARASKGRKTRYIVHNKLVNFMAPEDKTSWTEESKNELCKSIFAT